MNHNFGLKPVLKLFLMLMGLLSETKLYAFGLPVECKPYIGVGGSIRNNINLSKKKLHDILLNEPISHVHVIGGILFNEYLGVELGYDFNFNFSHDAYICDGECLPKDKAIISDRNFQNYEFNHAHRGINLGFITLLPIYQNSGNLFFSAGLSYSQIYSSVRFLGNTFDTPGNSKVKLNEWKNFEKRSFAPYLKTGFQHCITKDSIIRINVDLKHKDSVTYGIGIIYSL